MQDQQEKTLLKKRFVKEIEQVELWEELLKKSIVDEEQLDTICRGNIDKEKLKEVIKKYPMRINPYYLSLIKKKDDAVWKQCIPDVNELDDPEGFEDPLCEERDSPVPGLTHRYPDRVLFLVCNQCSMYCRFCTRKRKVGDPFKRITRSQIQRGIEYIKAHPEIRDVLLSGGDPFLLSDSYLEWILKQLRSIKHVEIIRIGTRVPCALPHRVTPELCSMLKKYHPLYINVHFAHPDEITDMSSSACNMLADSGILLSSQTVLLKGVNDDPKVMKDLMQKLLSIRVRPYYIYQADMTKGINHFRTKVEAGLSIISSIQGWTSGLAVPHFVIDSPGGGGKIPILPNYIVERDDRKIVLKNYCGKTFTYDEHC
ncbi:KamA family radical SAM protein [Candidatus Woesearchaeota archaeon]|nr:KamA family radical SAM protein [Candidatus Woesearchaeota archaeon]